MNILQLYIYSKLLEIACLTNCMAYRLKRVSVVGSSGSGKTTFASEIANIIDAKHIELDAIHWRQGWQEIPENEFIASVAECLSV